MVTTNGTARNYMQRAPQPSGFAEVPGDLRTQCEAMDLVDLHLADVDVEIRFVLGLRPSSEPLWGSQRAELVLRPELLRRPELVLRAELLWRPELVLRAELVWLRGRLPLPSADCCDVWRTRPIRSSGSSEARVFA
jgi:hypothetical protein